MMIEKDKYEELRAKIEDYGAQLIAVSKFQTIEKIEALYALGQRDFAENYVQELLTKQAYFQGKAEYQDIRWHFIGHLQRNKVKYLASFIYMIHSVDSLKLLQEIHKEAAKHNRSIKCLLQFYIAQEETKFGLDNREALELLETLRQNSDAYTAVELVGLMGMASFSDDEDLVRSEFQQLTTYFKHYKTTYFLLEHNFKELSIGMSADYGWALEEGSTMVRIGSKLFGNRK